MSPSTLTSSSMLPSQNNTVPLDAAAQTEIQKFIEQETSKNRIHSQIHMFTELCWNKCITKIGNRTSSSDQTCLENCVQRFLDTSMLLVNRLDQQRRSH
ncbi:Mitochondrial import inner membrane translocase subunit tim8 [Coelomomyces lativittatus]|nr:Mitochondrial import inner membrane translocase subunit tim8 [Coelomomyces lativittatus]KAJ1502054.1 Mitochondrial import inner membrane translocase subunit tim8 [Coelomomyces lativittatus]